jgi:hypothetical protein
MKRFIGLICFALEQFLARGGMRAECNFFFFNWFRLHSCNDTLFYYLLVFVREFGLSLFFSPTVFFAFIPPTCLAHFQSVASGLFVL